MKHNQDVLDKHCGDHLDHRHTTNPISHWRRRKKNKRVMRQNLYSIRGLVVINMECEFRDRGYAIEEVSVA